MIQIRSDAIDELELFELAADSGAEDVEEDGDVFVVITPVEAFETVQAKISAAGVKIEDSRLVRAPMTTVQKLPDQVRQTEALVAKLEDLQDVQEVFTNLEM